MNDPLCLEDSFGNFAKIFPVFNEDKIHEQMRNTLFANAKMMNLKVSASSILDLWNRLQMSLGHEFIGKKTLPSRALFVSLPSRRLCNE